MTTRAFGIRKIIVPLALAVTALFTAGSVFAEAASPPPLPPATLRVTASNSSLDNSVYDVLFSSVQTTLLNGDQNKSRDYQSLVYVRGASGGTDLLVADTVNGNIVRYSNPTGTPLVSSAVFWSFAASGGPQQPDGLSVDSSGNLYVVSSAVLGHAEVWVFPALAALTPSTPQPSGTPAGYGWPIRLDSFNPSTGDEVDSLVESVVVPATIPAATGLLKGDLLVLVDNSDFCNGDACAPDASELALVYRYSGLQAVINACEVGATGPVATCATKPTRSILLHDTQFPYPSGAVPRGMDLWPVDGSLLISTSGATILQYPLPAPVPGGTDYGADTAAASTTFATVSCESCQFFKLRTGSQVTGTPAQTYDYAFVTESTGTSSGNILEFASQSPAPVPPASGLYLSANAPVPTSSATPPTTSTTGSPEGLALGPAGTVVVSASSCIGGGTCNGTGALAGQITGNGVNSGGTGVSGNIIEQTCTFTDTRPLDKYGACIGTLTVNASTCPNLNLAANEIYTVPASICASPLTNNQPPGQPQQRQLGLIEGIASGVDNQPNIIVNVTENPSALFPAITFPTGAFECTPYPGGPVGGPKGTLQELGNATRMNSNEGIQPEDTFINNVMDVAHDVKHTFVPGTGYCDGGGGSRAGFTMTLVGGYLSADASSNNVELVGYADGRLAYLGVLVYGAPFITDPITGITGAQAQKQLGACLLQATATLNAGLLKPAQFTAAATQFKTCHALVYNHPGNYGSSTNYPNAYGAIIGRLQHLFYVTNTLILQQQTLGPLPTLLPLP